MTREAVPMIRADGMDVVAFGPSSHDDDAYYLVRSYRDLDDLRSRQDRFYSSTAWREGPQRALLSRIEHYLNTVLWLSPVAIASLREENASLPGR